MNEKHFHQQKRIEMKTEQCERSLDLSGMIVIEVAVEKASTLAILMLIMYVMTSLLSP